MLIRQRAIWINCGRVRGEGGRRNCPGGRVAAHRIAEYAHTRTGEALGARRNHEISGDEEPQGTQYDNTTSTLVVLET